MSKLTYKDMRNEMQMSQREVAKELNMAQPLYCAIENYKKHFTLLNATNFYLLYKKQTGNDIDFFTKVKHLA